MFLKLAAAAASVLMIGAVPALAQTHKHLATSAVGSAKVHKLHAGKITGKKLTTTKKHTAKLTARKAKTTASHHHKATKLDKTKSTKSIM